jgi:hypothetical protein
LSQSRSLLIEKEAEIQHLKLILQHQHQSENSLNTSISNIEHLTSDSMPTHSQEEILLSSVIPASPPSSHHHQHQQAASATQSKRKSSPKSCVPRVSLSGKRKSNESQLKIVERKNYIKNQTTSTPPTPALTSSAAKRRADNNNNNNCTTTTPLRK